VAARCLETMRATVIMDWSRVAVQGLHASAVNVCCSTWLRGRHPLSTWTDYTISWDTGMFTEDTEISTEYIFWVRDLYHCASTIQLPCGLNGL
jgi:hypothetical protein